MPTNVLLSVVADGRPAPPVLRRTSDGAELPLVSEGSHWRAATTLAAGVSHELWARMPSSACTTPRELVRVAGFTTGDGPDLVPPAPPTVRGVSACGVDSCPSSSCCGPYSVTSWWLDWTPSPDADVLFHETAEGGSFGTRYGTWFAGAAYPMARFESAAGSPSLSIVAVDHAGNRSVATAPIDASRCEPSGDAGAAGASAGGCAVPGRAGPARFVLALSVVVLFVLAARR